MPARFHLRVDRAREVDVAEHLQIPGVTPGRLVDLVDRTARNIAGIVDEDIDVGSILHKPGDVLGLAQVDDVSRGVDLMGEAQAFGERLQLVAAAGREPDMAAFFGKGFGGGRANALRCACYQDALAAQMEIHGITRLVGRRLIGWDR